VFVWAGLPKKVINTKELKLKYEIAVIFIGAIPGLHELFYER
jgi:hypothetical protein